MRLDSIMIDDGEVVAGAERRTPRVEKATAPNMTDRTKKGRFTIWIWIKKELAISTTVEIDMPNRDPTRTSPMSTAFIFTGNEGRDDPPR